MKRIMLIVIGSVFALNVLANDLSTMKDDANTMKYKYCAQVKDGKLTMMADDKVMTADVTLENGIVITTDASLVQKDGTRTPLKAGECVDTNGKIIPAEKEMKKDKPNNDYK